ncbi:MAG: S8/S53 family peptidase [Acidimicrobiia bacterium]
MAAGLVLAFSGTDSPRPTDVRDARAARADASDDPPSSATTTAPLPLEVVVDTSVQPAVTEVEGFADASAARPVGRVVTADGTATDVVLDEVQLLVPDLATLDAFVARWGGTVTDVTEPDTDGMRAALVHIDVDRADPAALPADLIALEPDHSGTMRVSSDRVQRLYAAIAADAVAHGTIVSPNTLAVDDAIVDGTTKEWDGWGDPNAFAWNIIRDGAAIDSGVGRAWQLLEATGKLDHRVRIMIVDGGFSSNPDFPDVTTLRLAKWGDTSRTSGGYHGTDVVMAAMAKVDNEFGTAGPAGPVAELIAVAKYVDDYKTLRKTLDMVREHDPDIISSSYHTTHVAFRDTTEGLKDWYYRRMRDNGAILFASAGNEGKNVDDGLCAPGDCDENKTYLPCESKYVVCVGGVDAATAKWDDGSNYGIVDNDKSVEIYGPWCTFAKKRNDAWIDFTMTKVCGTSFATPFVAGVTALVMAANPDLSNDDVRNILMDSAHSGMPLADRTRAGSSRWVDAFEAVRRALGIEVKAPAITIEKPEAGKVLGVNDWVDLRATATDFVGRPLDIVWTGDVAGALGTSGSGATNTVPLAPGKHEIIAWTTDFMGASSNTKVTIELRDSPPELTIVSPQPGTTRRQDDTLSFAAMTTDPDTYGSVPDDSVFWTVRLPGTDAPLWSGTGHLHEVEGSEFAPGDYEIVVTASDGPNQVAASSSFTIEAPDPDAPKVYLDKPAAGFTTGADHREKEIEFAGKAHDLTEGWLDGTRLKWTATSDAQTKVLCAGSQVPGVQSGDGTPGDDIAAVVSCSEFTASLGLDNGATQTVWTIALEAWDASGSTSTVERSIVINFAAP